MAEVIDSLLVRLGLEADAKEFREAQALFDGVKTKALQFGAVIGAGLGVQNLTFGFAAAKTELADFAEVYGTTAQFVDSLSYALQQSGAKDPLGAARKSIERIRDLLEDTEWGEVAEKAFRVAGFDPYLLQGVTDLTEAYERLSGAVQGLSQEDARRALSSLGFSDTEIRLFRSGPESLRQTLEEAESYARVTQEMTDKAQRFSGELTKLSRSVEGVSNELSTLILPHFSNSMKTASDYLRDNRSELVEFFREALPWLEATAVGIGALVALQAGQKGLAMLGPLARAGGPIAAVATAYQFAQENPSHLQHSKDALLADGTIQGASRWLGELTGWEAAKEFGSMAGGEVAPEDVWHSESGVPGFMPPPLPPPSPPAAPQNTTIVYETHVDARGSSSPAEVEAAARRGAEASLRDAAENARAELRGPMK